MLDHHIKIITDHENKRLTIKTGQAIPRPSTITFTPDDQSKPKFAAIVTEYVEYTTIAEATIRNGGTDVLRDTSSPWGTERMPVRCRCWWGKHD